MKQKNVEISALAFYPNTMDGNLKKRQENIAHLKKVIDILKLIERFDIVHLLPDEMARVIIQPEILRIDDPKQLPPDDGGRHQILSAGPLVSSDIGYEGYTCIEVEDKAFEGSRERVLDSIRLSKRYLEQFVI